MKRLLTIAAPIAFGALVFVAYASTSGAHFMSYSDAVISGGQLSVSFDESGLGNEDINYTLTASATYDWGCINGGGNHPQATNKETKTTPVAGGGTFQPRNGRLSATVLAPPTAPDPPSTFSCPGGQTLILADAAYTNIVLTDTSNNVAIDPPDVSRVFVTFK